MKQEFYTPNGYQTVESVGLPYTFVFLVNKGGQWTPQSFTTTEEYGAGFQQWERRNYNKLEEGAEWGIYPVVRYEDADMLFAELNAAVAQLAVLSEDEQPYQLARIRTLTTKWDRVLHKAEFNRKMEAANVTA